MQELTVGLPKPYRRERPRDSDEADFLRSQGTPEHLIGPPSDDAARRAFAAPPASGSFGEIDLALLDPRDPDERRLLIEAEHPELAEALEGGGDDVLVVDGEEMNPRLHLTIHEVVATQLWENDPPEAWQTARRLLELGYERHEILHMLGSALVPQLWRVLADRKPADHEAYLRDLAALPGSWERQRGERRRAGSMKAKLAARARKAKRQARKRNRRS